MANRGRDKSKIHGNVSQNRSDIMIRRDYNKEISLTQPVTSNMNVNVMSRDDCADSSKRLKRSFSLSNVNTTVSDVFTMRNTVTGQTTVPTQNMYELLSDADVEETCTVNEQRTTWSNSKKCRLPPISIVNVGTKQTRELLNLSNIPQNGYHVKAVKSGTQLFVSEEAIFNAAVNALRDSNIEFFTHTPSNKQPVRIILSGLPLFDLNELTDELQRHGVRPLECRIFSRKKIGPEESVLYLLYFEKGSVKLPELQKITGLFCTVVKWRFFSRRATDAVQCHRCQKFGHGMRHCYVSPLCVKCGEKHASNSCKLPAKAALKVLSSREIQSLRSELRCANCSGNHAANFRDCPARKKYLHELESSRQRSGKKSTMSGFRSSSKQGNTKPLATNSGIQSQTNAANRFSYSQVLQGASTQPTDTEQSSNLFGLPEFMGLANELFQRLEGCKTKGEQFLALSELIIKFIYNV